MSGLNRGHSRGSKVWVCDGGHWLPFGVLYDQEESVRWLIAKGYTVRVWSETSYSEASTGYTQYSPKKK